MRLGMILFHRHSLLFAYLPRVVSLPFTTQGYTVTGNIVSVNDEVHDFSLPINELPQGFQLDMCVKSKKHQKN